MLVRHRHRRSLARRQSPGGHLVTPPRTAPRPRLRRHRPSPSRAPTSPPLRARRPLRDDLGERLGMTRYGAPRPRPTACRAVAPRKPFPAPRVPPRGGEEEPPPPEVGRRSISRARVGVQRAACHVAVAPPSACRLRPRAPRPLAAFRGPEGRPRYFGTIGQLDLGACGDSSAGRFRSFSASSCAKRPFRVTPALPVRFWNNSSAKSIFGSGLWADVSGWNFQK